jgi:hypothetical protein
MFKYSLNIILLLFVLSSNSQDTLNFQDSFNLSNSHSPSWKLILHTDFFKKHTSGLGIIYSAQKINITAGVSFLHFPIFKNQDTLYSTLPYASNSNTLFYEVRSYSNQKTNYRIGLETNFKYKKNRETYNLGLNLTGGTYSFQDDYADIYYQFYRDSISGNLYYEDMYGDPTFDPLNAFAQVRNFSKADMKFKTLGFEPYLLISNKTQKSINFMVYIGCKYELFFVSETYYLDYADVLESPNENFSKFSWFLRFALTFDLEFKT